MELIVKEQLELRGLSNLFPQEKFNQYKNKIVRQTPGANKYWLALGVFDMFIINK